MICAEAGRVAASFLLLNNSAWFCHPEPSEGSGSSTA
jgi:hypothetical protein